MMIVTTFGAGAGAGGAVVVAITADIVQMTLTVPQMLFRMIRFDD